MADLQAETPHPRGGGVCRGPIVAAVGLVGLLNLGAVAASAPTGHGPVVASLTVAVREGQATTVQAWKTGGAWTLQVRDPAGSEEAAVSWTRPAVTTLTWTARSSGSYAVECRPAGESEATCEVEVVRSAPGGPEATRRVEAEGALRRGYGSLELWAPDAARRARREFRGAYDRSRDTDFSDLWIDSLMGLATVDQLSGEVEPSLSPLQEALAKAREAGDARRVVLASIRLASSFVTLGDGDRAEPLVDEAMRRSRAAGFLLGEAEARRSRGDLHYLRSELLEARDDYRQALEAFVQLGDVRGLAEAHLDLGYALADLSEDARARGHFERALELARAATDKRLEADALRVLGNVHAKMSEEYEAIRYFESAQPILEAVDDKVALVGLYNGLGDVHARVNDLTAAVQYYERAETLARATGFRVGEGVALLEIAKCQQALTRLDAAAETYRKAHALLEAAGDAGMAASAQAGLGSVYAEEGRLDEAVRLFQAALGVMRSVGETRLSAGILGDVADAELARGRTGPARGAAQEALRLAREAVDPAREARALFLLARVARMEGALDEARRYAESSLKVGESMRGRVPGFELRALFFEELGSRYSFYVDLLMQLAAAKPTASYPRLAFEASEKGRARVLLDQIGRRVRREEPADAADLERERALREEIKVRALREDLGVGDEGPEGDVHLGEMLAELRRLRGLTRSAPRPAEAVTSGLAEIQRELAAQDTLLIEYSLGAERSYLWTISPERFRVHVLPARETLERQTREAYALLTSRQREREGSAAELRERHRAQDARFFDVGSALARTLLGPIEELDRFERLIVVSDGVLSYLPFSALPDPRATEASKDYVPLVLSHEIVRAPSLSLLLAMQRKAVGSGPLAGVQSSRTGPRSRIAVLADPVFTLDDPRIHGKAHGSLRPAGGNLLALSTSLRGTGQSLSTLPRLLASREEASSIARAAPGADVTIATGFRASQATALAMLQGPYRVVHFATHGILNDEHPELSGLIMSLVDDRGALQDGFLRAQDVYGLRVNADLVVLSACETALGRMLRGEGITGLVHAFLRGGARTVVASKWRVDDVATEELMSEFYRRLLAEGEDPATALRLSQIKLFRRKRTRAPFFWGAFEVHGMSPLAAPFGDEAARRPPRSGAPR